LREEGWADHTGQPVDAGDGPLKLACSVLAQKMGSRMGYYDYLDTTA